MAVDGKTATDTATVVGLQREIRDSGLLISPYRGSPMNVRLRQLLTDGKRRDLTEAVEQLSTDPLPDNEERYWTTASASVRLVIIWAGGKLPARFTQPIRQAYQRLGAEGRDGKSSGELAKILAVDGAGWQLVHQTLDQEEIHLEVVGHTAGKLTAAGGAPLTVFRPPDDSLIRRSTLDIPGEWIPYGFTAAPKAVSFPVPGPAPANVLVVTIGHGDEDGRTFFPPVFNITAGQIAAGLGLSGYTRALVVPLQCFPQNSVVQWQAVNVGPAITAVSIRQLAESDDGEMIRWIESDLDTVTGQWLYDLPL